MVSVVYGVLVAIYTWNSFPSLETLKHEPGYLALMLREANEALKVEPRTLPKDKKAPTEMSLREFLILGERGPDKDVTPLEMPNGHVFSVAAHLTPEQKSSIAREYTRVIEASLWQKRINAVAFATAAWLVPIALLCLLGLTARWIYTGFKS